VILFYFIAYIGLIVSTCHPESIVINSPGNKKSSAIFYLMEVIMSKQWHILIVLDEEYLSRNIVQSLQIDGYFVKGASSATEAVHLLWAEEYDIVISDQKMPDSHVSSKHSDDNDWNAWLFRHTHSGA
jgi:PleD family two-component response regulator